MPKGLRPITTYDVFNGAQTVTTAAAITSQPFDLREIAQEGLFSIGYANATSGGTLAITYTMCSHKAGTYFTPTGGVRLYQVWELPQVGLRLNQKCSRLLRSF